MLPEWKSKTVVLSVAVLVGFLSIPHSGSAQGMSSILQKLEQLEARVGELDSSLRRDVAGLENRMALAERREGPDSGTIQILTDRLEGVEGDLETLHREVASTVDPTLIHALRDELRVLMEEIRTLADGEEEEANRCGAEPSDSPVEVLASPSEEEVQEPTLEEEAQGPTPEAGEDQLAPTFPGALEITGFVDASYSYDETSPHGTSYGLDQAEVDIGRQFGTRGSLRMDVEFTNDGAGGFSLGVEQGYLTFSPFGDLPLEATLGKFNAPIGFELLDAPDMYQFSHALVFDHGLPTNLTGAMLSAPLSESADLTVYVSNGWDEDVELGGGKTVGGRLGITHWPFLSFGISGIWDVGGAGEDPRTAVFDLDLAASIGDAWAFGGEVNQGRTRIGQDEFAWWGILAMAHRDFTSEYGLTLRYDLFDDEGGSRLGSGEQELRQAFTLAPTFALGGGMGALVEFRADWSDHTVFLMEDGGPGKTKYGIAVEMTYSF